MLNLYTPVNEFEERVSVSFIRTIQVRSPRLSFAFDSPTQSFEWKFYNLLKGNAVFIIIILSHFYSALTFLITPYWKNEVILKQI